MIFNYGDVAQMDEDIRALEHRLLTLKRKRNSLITLCRLPDELLVKILHNLQVKARGFTTDTDFFNFHSHDFSWTRLSHVCKHIHTVAITTPQLWAWVVWTKPPEWNSLVITRSKSAPKTVYRTRIRDPEVWASILDSKLAHGVVVHAQIDLYKENIWSNMINFTWLTVLHVGNMSCSKIEHADILATLAPQLIELCAFEPELHTWPKLAWPKLRRFHISTPSTTLGYLTDMVSGMQELRVLSFYYIQPPRRQLTFALDYHPSTYSSAKGFAESSSSLGDNNGFMLECLSKVTIEDKIDTMLTLLEDLSRMKRVNQYPCLALQAFSTVTVEDVARLMDLLSRQWGWITAQRAAPATLIWHHITKAPDEHILVVSVGKDNMPSPTLTLKVPFHKDHIGVYSQHSVVVTSLEVTRVLAEPNTFRDLDEIVLQQFPDITNVIFRSIRGLDPFRAWAEGQRANGRMMNDSYDEDCHE